MDNEQVEKIASIIEHALQSSQYFTSLYNGRSKDASAALRDAARAAIAALGDGWRDIASAPATGPVLLYRPTLRGEVVPKIMSSAGRRPDGMWFNWNYYCVNGEPLPDEHPTHWAPLPPPPGAKP